MIPGFMPPLGNRLVAPGGFGSELLTHPWTEAESIEGWTAGGAVTIAYHSGRVSALRASGAADRLYRAVTLEVGEEYQLEFNVLDASAQCSWRVVTATNFTTNAIVMDNASEGSNIRTFTATHASCFIGHHTFSGTVNKLSVVSLRKIL